MPRSPLNPGDGRHGGASVFLGFGELDRRAIATCDPDDPILWVCDGEWNAERYERTLSQLDWLSTPTESIWFAGVSEADRGYHIFIDRCPAGDVITRLRSTLGLATMQEFIHGEPEGDKFKFHDQQAPIPLLWLSTLVLLQGYGEPLAAAEQPLLGKLIEMGGPCCGLRPLSRRRARPGHDLRIVQVARQARATGRRDMAVHRRAGCRRGREGRIAYPYLPAVAGSVASFQRDARAAGG